MRSLPIDKKRLPYIFDIELSDRAYTITCNYNSSGNFFTLDIEGEDVTRYGEKVTLGKPLFEDIISETLLPVAPAEDAERVGYRELNETVYIFILGGA